MDLVSPALRQRPNTGARSHSGIRVFLLAVVVLVLLAPGAYQSAGPAPSPTLAHTLESRQAVATAVVQAFADRDLRRLQDLALAEVEFRDLVWPRLPASRPERNLPLDYVWSDLQGKSQANLRARLAGWVDRGFVVVSVESKGGVTDYGTFKVHRDSALVLRDREGREQEGRLFGSIIEYQGRYKVFSYAVD